MALHTVRAQGLLLNGAIGGEYTLDHQAHDTNLIAAANRGSLRGFVGGKNSGAPTTSFDMRADEIVLRSATGAALPLLRTQAATLTNNTSLAGPARNGRDQSAGFADGWIHFYFIWNSSTVATLSSQVPPPTGPTLPSGDTHWTYACSVPKHTGVGLRPVSVQGAFVRYEVGDGGANRLVNNGVSTSFVTVDCTGWVPPTTRMVYFGTTLNLQHSTTTLFQMALTQTGIAVDTIVVGVTAVASGTVFISRNWVWMTTNAVQQVSYRMTAEPNQGGGAFLDVLGFVVPNGDY